ncbi:DUF3313 domain-containing protein [bacterium]|nr:DUF3313 domain-containing protein [bacterium]
MKRTGNLFIIVILGISVGISGCKAPPKKETSDFVTGEIMDKHDDLPFHKAWIKEGFDKSRFTKIHIPPVNTSYIFLDENDWWKNSFKSYAELKKDVNNMGVFMQKTFVKAFKDDPKKRFKVTKKPDDKTLILELAITELTPNKPYLKIARFAPFGAGAAVTLLNQTNLSTVSFEAKLRDGKTGEIVAMFADREQEKKYLLTTKNWYWYSHAKEIIEDWAEQFVELGNQEPGEIIKDSAAFGLKPW